MNKQLEELKSVGADFQTPHGPQSWDSNGR